MSSYSSFSSVLVSHYRFKFIRQVIDSSSTLALAVYSNVHSCILSSSVYIYLSMYLLPVLHNILQEATGSRPS